MNLTQSRLTSTQIGTVPVQPFLEEDCVLALLVHSQSLLDGMGLLSTWNFSYATKLPLVPDPQKQAANGPTYDLLIGRQGYVSINTTTPTVLIEDNLTEYVYQYLGLTYPGAYLEVDAYQKKEGWYCWGTEVQSTIDLLQGLPIDFLQDQTIQAILNRIQVLTKTQSRLQWEIGDAINELQQNGFSKEESYRAAIRYMEGSKDTRWALKLSNVSKTFHKRDRDYNKTWISYYERYRIIKERQKLLARKRRRESMQFNDRLTEILSTFQSYDPKEFDDVHDDDELGLD